MKTVEELRQEVQAAEDRVNAATDSYVTAWDKYTAAYASDNPDVIIPAWNEYIAARDVFGANWSFYAACNEALQQKENQ